MTNLDGYVRIVKDKSLLRKMIFNAQKLIDRCLIGEEEPDVILASAEESMLKLGESRTRTRPHGHLYRDRGQLADLPSVFDLARKNDETRNLF